MAGSPNPLGELARLFLKLGAVGFGGPAAHIALMRDEVVRRRGWMDDERFLDLVGATNLLPGPNSTELAIHLGQERAGRRGLLVAGACFIGPAVLVVGVLAWLYERHGTDPRIVDLRYGVLPVIIAVVAHAVWGLGRTAIDSLLPALLAAGALAGFLLGGNELVVLAAAGVLSALWSNRARLAGGPLLGVLAVPVSLPRLFVVFLEVGGVLYGSGYVLLAFLQRHLVDGLGWLTDQQLLDAVAVGQVTPGPVFSTATFVGWQVAGLGGAAVATTGIFLPSFAFVALLGRIVPWLQGRPTAKAFLRGVTVASLGLMAGVLVELVDVAVVDFPTAAMAVAGLVLLVTTEVGATWLVAAGAAVGLGHAWLG